MDDIITNTLRFLSLDMIDNSNSGHPGMPLGCAAIMYVLWCKIMIFNPKDILNINRDRFILSNGHGCALLYSMLHLLEFNYSIDDLKHFRKINSRTPGHPEYNPKLGIEITTGPLGQGISNGVGMAIASKKMDVNNTIFVMCGDGCLMEGISYESCSLAGHLKLDNLVLLYDDNNITIDGNTNISFSENVSERFSSMNWNVYNVYNGNTDYMDIYNKIIEAKISDKPSIVIIKTNIGYGSVLENSNKSHGAPFGYKITKEMKKKFKYNSSELFFVSEDVKEYFTELKKIKNKEFKMKFKDEKLYNLEIEYLSNNIINSKEICSTRELSGKILYEIINSNINNNNIIIGSADLSESNKIPFSNLYISKNNYKQPYLHYGIREHSMAGIANGISTYGLLPIIGTFLMFINYCLASIRLAALSKHKVIYILTHDSVFLGEDGPTHQPIESLTILRSIPNLITIRPCNFEEVKQSYYFSLNNNGPTALILSRQGYKMIECSNTNINNGAYIIHKELEKLKYILIATGSEVSLAIDVANILKNIRVISMPSFELFELQSDSYKKLIFPNDIIKISLEAGSSLLWYKYANYCYGIDTYGESGNISDIKKHFKFNKNDIIEYILNI
jgi:transketolase